jgi:uncharacterized protein (DUF736 family)
MSKINIIILILSIFILLTPLVEGACPAITTQPSSKTICIGSTATFTVTASNSPTGYQWQYSTDGGSNWASVSGGSGGTTYRYITSSATAGMNGYLYRVVVSKSGCSQLTSNVVTLTVNTAIATQPSSKTVCIGNTATFTVTASGSSLSYQWQQSTDGGSNWAPVSGGSGGTTSSYTTSSATTGMNGYQYRVVVAKSGCSQGTTSSAATLTVNPTTSITTQPSSQTVSTDIAAFGVTATGNALTYLWQQSTDGGTSWSGISGQTAATLALSGVNAGMSGYQYRVVVTGSCGSPVTSNAAILTFRAIACGISGPDAFCDSSSATYIPTLDSVLAPGGYAYHWKLGAEAKPDGSSLLLPGTSLIGFYYLQLAAQEISSGGNVCSCTKQITVVPKPVATITSS